MQLTPREADKLLIYVAADVARRRRARGLRLNVPEATALITEAMLEGARDGRSVSEVMALARTILGRDDVMEHVPELITAVQVEAAFGGGEMQIERLFARREFQIGANLTGLGLDDPDANFYENYACGSSRNYTDYCSEATDKLIELQSAELDRAKRLHGVDLAHQMIIRNRIIEAELVKQMTLIAVLKSHHRPPPTPNVVRRRNHRSPKPSNHFCNKIGTNQKSRHVRFSDAMG